MVNEKAIIKEIVNTYWFSIFSKLYIHVSKLDKTEQEDYYNRMKKYIPAATKARIRADLALININDIIRQYLVNYQFDKFTEKQFIDHIRSRVIEGICDNIKWLMNKGW